MRPFQYILEHPVYWALNRRNVTRAFAIGLFVAYIPLPIQLILSTTLALFLRLNIAAAVAGSLLTNPLTAVPLFFFAYWVGCRLLGWPLYNFQFEPSWQWLTTSLLPIWKPFLLGCVVMGIISAMLGYLVLGAVWHLSLVLKYRQRKERGNSTNSSD